MSFSQDVKTELEDVISGARHCQLAEIYGIEFYASKELDQSSPAGRKTFTLRKKTSMISRCVETTIRNSCCKRAFLRGTFLSVGSISDPQKSYNMEFVCDGEEKALLVKEYMGSFGVDVRITKRKASFVAYIKDAEGLVNALNVIGAHNSLMFLENLRVEKEFRNQINRKVNCEAANIGKTVNAANKQISDIQKIDRVMGLEKLPENLRKVALVRLEHTESSLSELGQFLDPPVGKSGVNHRIRKLMEIADSIDE